MIRAYELLDTNNGEISLPAVVIVGADRQIAWRYVGQNPKDRPAEDQVLERLDALLGG
ncbi:hypothetical protein PPSIR1_07857 [Plesiocystis pacifica SIR-1]|uniref:Redoxin domain-containing protein n=1 Tax=Plesiocystis pacifica SIR-1 TaxID=391625 RepID=A6GCW6_9BACT|nr:hypothetical protein PPSIR1_07857 [Plesiocystis pacifica SIR-1]